jgi:murein DD-endopeptidase MepM/ murein hydrolase activator NlpD
MRRVVISIFLFAALSAWAESGYPCIRALKHSDVLFAQLQDDIETYYRACGYGRGRPFPALSFFTYVRQKDDTIFSLASRLNLPYETIATLNGLSQAQEFLGRDEILIPNMPGIFVPEEPANALEEIMISWRGSRESPGEKITVKLPDREKTMTFFRGERFHSVERAYFLKILFLFPLAHFVRTSDFGMRADPVTGRPEFHGGIDLAAPLGTPVCAAREGVVKETGFDAGYGNFVRIAHPAGYETLYGHLSVIYVKRGDKVNAGLPLGKVGLTGRTTGPHLHFEVLKNGKPIDPSPYLP